MTVLNAINLRRFMPILWLVLILLVPFLWVVNCTGPIVVVKDMRMQAPSSTGQPYQLSARLYNEAYGHGTVDVLFTLRSKQTGLIYRQDSTIYLRSGQTAVVTASISAPKGSYIPDVDAVYPVGYR